MGKYSNVIIQLLVNVILSRLLTPHDYGIVAVVNVFLIFFQMLADFGIGPAIIQNKNLTKQDIKHIFAFSIYMAVGLGILFVFLGYPISLFYSDTVYMPISVLLGVNIFFYALLIVPQNLLLKNKQFKNVNVVIIVSNLTSGVIQIILAFSGAKYYAIIFGNIVKAMIMFGIFYYQTRVPISFQTNLESLKKIYHFSRNQFIFNFINYFSRNLDKMLIGRYMGETPLGYYDKAYQVSLYPNQMLTNVITPVVQPIMSEYETETDKIKKVYLRITQILGTIGIPLSVFLFFSAFEVIAFLFGNQWDASVLIFQILCFSIWEQMISSSTGAIYQSANRTDLLLVSGVVSAVINIAGIVIGILLGRIEYVATMLVITFTINFLINNYLLMYRLFDSNYGEFFAELKKPVVMGLMQLAVFILLPELPFANFFNLVIKGSLFVAMFVLGLLVTGQLKLIINVIKKQVP